ncbi:MAG: hypothetical protein OET44_16240 [Gammaproteobacteria bacterium]|nr:hypothetical protein [Gammaproteobacteria bacterium]
MTLLTTVTVASTVNVFCRMAGAAILWRFFVTLSGVAKFATDLFVFTTQWKLGRIMIEPRIAPCSLLVAIATLVAEFPPMMIVVAMTIHTAPWRRAIFVFRLVACGATRRLVRAA